MTLPQPPPAVPDLDPCSVSGLPQPGSGSRVIDVTGAGTHTGKSATITSSIQLKEGDPDLVVVVEDDLEVAADILFPQQMLQPNARSINITLVSLQGTVTVAAGVLIGGGVAAAGISGSGRCPGGDGVQGGNIKILGINIDIQGILKGNEGGAGGSYTLTGGSEKPLVAGNGGKGGSISLCALETIRLNEAIAGLGGCGGNGVATQDVEVILSGAEGGPGGDILVYGSDPGGASVQVEIGLAIGGQGRVGGLVNATAQTYGSRSGADAVAGGGSGGDGGTVLFQQAEVLYWGIVSAGDGGPGGRAFAHAGDGANQNRPWTWSAKSGGDATAEGGSGGSAGSVPQIPTQALLVPGSAGSAGSGGKALAASGAGGDGSSNGGSSGLASAYGGANGNGALPGPPRPVQDPPNPPTGPMGGVRSRAQQDGAR